MSREQVHGKPSPPPLSQGERGTVALSPCGGELERGLTGMRPAAIAPQGDSDPLRAVKPARARSYAARRRHEGVGARMADEEAAA